MKKLLFLIFALFLVGVSAKAQHATAQKNMAGKNVTVEYYNNTNNGHLVIYNNTDYEIGKLHVRVTVKVTSYNELNMKQEKILVLCEDDVTDIPTGKKIVYKTNRGAIKGGPEKEGKTYEYSIEL